MGDAEVEGTLTFVVTGRHAARVHTLQRLRNAWHLTVADVDVHGGERDTTEDHDDHAVGLTAHCWLPDGQLYLGNDAGELMVRPSCEWVSTPQLQRASWERRLHFSYTLDSLYSRRSYLPPDSGRAGSDSAPEQTLNAPFWVF